MARLLEIVFIFILSSSFFFLGVKYSAKVKENVGWMFEYKENEVELSDAPKASDIKDGQLESQDDDIDNLNTESEQDGVDQGQLPEEDKNIIPAIYDE
jgi:hypothetical protein